MFLGVVDDTTECARFAYHTYTVLLFGRISTNKKKVCEKYGVKTWLCSYATTSPVNNCIPRRSWGSHPLPYWQYGTTITGTDVWDNRGWDKHNSNCNDSNIIVEDSHPSGTKGSSSKGFFFVMYLLQIGT